MNALRNFEAPCCATLNFSPTLYDTSINKRILNQFLHRRRPSDQRPFKGESIAAEASKKLRRVKDICVNGILAWRAHVREQIS